MVILARVYFRPSVKCSDVASPILHASLPVGPEPDLSGGDIHNTRASLPSIDMTDHQQMINNKEMMSPTAGGERFLSPHRPFKGKPRNLLPRGAYVHDVPRSLISMLMKESEVDTTRFSGACRKVGPLT